MKQLIEEQKKEFNQKFRMIEVVGDNEADGTFVIEHDKEKVWNWHKQSLKQFIDGLIEREEGTITGIGILDDSNLSWTWDVAKKNTIAHLKELKEELN